MALFSTSDSLSTASCSLLPVRKQILERWKVPSSPHTSYELDEPPYLITTEKGQQAALTVLKDYPPNENGVFLGFAFEFNYNILANRTFKRAIICDINKRMHEIYQWTAHAVIRNESHEEFLEAFRDKISENPEYFCHLMLDPMKVFAYYSEKPFIWTASPDQYQRIRILYQRGLIAHRNLDLINDSDYFDRLRNWADRNGYVFDCIYVSNIPEWAQRYGFGHVNRIKENLLKILNPTTILLDAKQEGFESGEPIIRLSSHIHSMENFPSFKPSVKRKNRSK